MSALQALAHVIHNKAVARYVAAPVGPGSRPRARTPPPLPNPVLSTPLAPSLGHPLL